MKHGLKHVLVQRDWEVSEAYQSLATPSAVLIDLDGRIASTAAAGADAIRRLVSESRRGIPVITGHQRSNGHGHADMHRGVPAGLPIGQRAPAVSLPDLDARIVNLADRAGPETLLLFWNPDCGFCQQMLPELREWEHRRPRVDLLVLSSGSVEANRAMGLSSPLLLDEGGKAMRVFGANGTPMAVLIDPAGRVGSNIAAGAPAVLALLRSRNIPVRRG
jgi:peroxiredoxin